MGSSIDRGVDREAAKGSGLADNTMTRSNSEEGRESTATAQVASLQTQLAKANSAKVAAEVAQRRTLARLEAMQEGSDSEDDTLTAEDVQTVVRAELHAERKQTAAASKALLEAVKVGSKSSGTKRNRADEDDEERKTSLGVMQEQNKRWDSHLAADRSERKENAVRTHLLAMELARAPVAIAHASARSAEAAKQTEPDIVGEILRASDKYMTVDVLASCKPEDVAHTLGLVLASHGLGARTRVVNALLERGVVLLESIPS
jgi:uncharacterized protein (DUF885 family)